MGNMRITKKSVDALACPAGKDREFLWDSALSGFGVAALATGNKVYVVQYRQARRSRRITLGKHGALTPDEARERAKEVLGDVARDKDPIAERRARQNVRNFKEVAEDFLRLHVAPKKKPRTYEEYGRLLRLHLYPALGGKPITSITKSDVSRLHTGLGDRPSAGNRCLALLDTIWNWAVAKNEIEGPTPSKGLERNPEKCRERYLTSDELRRLGKVLKDAETVGIPWVVDEQGPKAKHLPKKGRATIVDPHAVAAIRLLMLTGARLREILHARWDYVDWARGMMFLPDSKTGRKTLYLSDVALGILEDLPRVQGNPYIIPGGVDGRPRADLKRPWAAILRAAGLSKAVTKAPANKLGKRLSEVEQPGLRIHDLRHTFASLGVGGSIGLPVVGKLLGHTQARTTQRYAHLDADPLHKAANMIGSQIAAALDAPERPRLLEKAGADA